MLIVTAALSSSKIAVIIYTYQRLFILLDLLLMSMLEIDSTSSYTSNECE